MVGEEDGLKDESKLDLRSRQAEYKRRLLQPIKSKEELLEILASPLQFFNVLPKELKCRSYGLWKGCTEADKKKLLSATIWISDVQKILLEKVLVDWQETLEADDLLDVILVGWFAPRLTSTSLNDEAATAGSIQMATLKTISTIFSTSSSSLRDDSSRESPIASKSPLEIALQPEAISLLQKIITLLIGNFSLVSTFQSLQEYQITVKISLVWNDVIRELVALPDYAANATRGNSPIELLRENYVKFLASQLRDILLHSDCPSDLLAALIAKLYRSGYFQEITSEVNEPINLWPTIIRKCIEKPIDRWSRMLSSANTTINQGLLHSLISFVDRFSFRSTPGHDLISGDELLRPGAEGTEFLSSNNWEVLLRVASILEVFLPRASTSSSKETSDSEDDLDENESMISFVIFSSSGSTSWSPLTARLLVHLFCKSSTQAAISIALERSVELWSSVSRIKTAPWDQDVYLTLVVLLLISEASSESKAKLRTSSKLIGGVSSHLEHLDSKYRRMGMLIAEIVSSAGEGTSKPLSFGRSIWDGKGEGKEESRVLRAVYLGWKGRERTLDRSNETSLLESFGLLANEHSMEKQEVVVLPTRTRLPPQTRKLPQRKPATLRKRLLIEPLDDDEKSLELENQDTLLPPLTRIQSRPRYISESEASSSSEDESDDSEGESMVPPTDTEKKEEEFGMNIPQKKKKRLPVYINELSALFREQDREANRLALKHSEQLIKRKAGWGGEVDENAIDLAIAIISMQNNFRFKHFEDRKRDALTALVCASPNQLGPCLAEQFFNTQYSISQRVLILKALAFGARQMTQQNNIVEHLGLQTLAEDLSQLSMTRSRIEGEQRLPEIQRERSLLVNQHNILDAKNEIIKSSNGKNKAFSNVYLDLAGPAFIFPLINRFHAQLEHQNRVVSRYRRSGSGILLDPFIISAFLDTLTILCYCAQNVVNFSSDIVPEVISLGLAITNTALARSAKLTVTEESEAVSSSILGAAANLFLVLLDAVSQLDGARMLLSKHAQMVQLVESWAGALFESIDGQGGRGANRAASGAAAILLCIDKLKQSTM